MTKTRASQADIERRAEAVAWVTKQLRFEHVLGSLERRIASQLDDVQRRQ